MYYEIVDAAFAVLLFAISLLLVMQLTRI